MRLLFLLYACIITLSCKAASDHIPKLFDGAERFIASTPANSQVKAFLDIPAADSVDFIRWDITFSDKQYKLSCQYGISKPNTRGFMEGGHRKEIADDWIRSGNERHLKNGSKSIKLIELNSALLHFVDGSGKFMRGNGGWSYTLNSAGSKPAGDILISRSSNILRDSVKYEGRTPAGIPGIPDEPVYNKLKWQIVLYADAGSNTPTTYRALSAPWRDRGGKKGPWKIIRDAQGRVTYQLLNADDTVFVSLLKPDDIILLFTDGNGRLLTGNEDFSYTLNRYF